MCDYTTRDLNPAACDLTEIGGRTKREENDVHDPEKRGYGRKSFFTAVTGAKFAWKSLRYRSPGPYVRNIRHQMLVVTRQGFYQRFCGRGNRSLEAMNINTANGVPPGCQVGHPLPVSLARSYDR